MIAYYISRAPRSAPAADERDCPPNRLSKHTDLNEISTCTLRSMAFHAMRGSAHSRATSGRTVTQTIPTRSRPIRSTEALNAYMYHKRYESTPPAERMLRSTPAACAPDSALPSPPIQELRPGVPSGNRDLRAIFRLALCARCKLNALSRQHGCLLVGMLRRCRRARPQAGWEEHLCATGDGMGAESRPGA
jgi:hypothetical protein